MGDSNVTKITDKYSEDIEFYNACRQHYLQRVEATKLFKLKTASLPVSSASDVPTTRSPPLRQCERQSSLEESLVNLRKEMSSLMDMDLSLMKQMLTLNEAIEEMKAKRLYTVSKDSLCESSGRMTASDFSVSDNNF
ncbi:hypothetical protein FSP39_012222 [Pinctada imbricata]|uniref:Uncharacterized protein n=1 Tax=Pinctada imbricata TaxID=66713 RepID=A0AA88XRI2_PINIB|nr:hypothetical protein FSP39_012222 [Pinctada imbricata]